MWEEALKHTWIHINIKRHTQTLTQTHRTHRCGKSLRVASGRITNSQSLHARQKAKREGETEFTSRDDAHLDFHSQGISLLLFPCQFLLLLLHLRQQTLLLLQQACTKTVNVSLADSKHTVFFHRNMHEQSR